MNWNRTMLSRFGSSTSMLIDARVDPGDVLGRRLGVSHVGGPLVPVEQDVEADLGEASGVDRARGQPVVPRRRAVCERHRGHHDLIVSSFVGHGRVLVVQICLQRDPYLSTRHGVQGPGRVDPAVQPGRVRQVPRQQLEVDVRPSSPSGRHRTSSARSCSPWRSR